jgi:hypothetical protein
MNISGLAKLYDQLSPRERLSMIVAAQARRDEVESERLAQSAPKVAFRTPDYFGLGMAQQESLLMHVIDTLELVALLWRTALGAASSDGRINVRDEALNRLIKLFSYVLTTRLDAWQRLMRERNIDGDFLLNDLPWYKTVRHAEPIARTVAFTREEATAWLRQSTGDTTSEVITVERELASMREFLERRAAWWGSQ